MVKLLACHCLNVIIESNGDDFLEVTKDLLENLTEAETGDPFFKQSPKLVGKLININKSHSGLIQTRNVGCWIVHYCVNCDVHSHAVHKEKGAACVLVNSELLDCEKINKLRASEDFSKLFKIVVKINEGLHSPFVPHSYLPDEVQSVIKSIKDLASDILKRESLATENRIEEYSEQQFNMLNELKERAFREQQAIIRTIIESTSDSSAKRQSTKLIFNSPKGLPSRLNEPLAAGSVKTSQSQKTPNMRPTPKRQKSCPSGHVTSFDSEGLFQFDGMDPLPSASESEVEESDVDDNNRQDEGMKVQREDRTLDGASVIAKSLPMSIPAFMSQARSRDPEDADDVIPLGDPVDIAASIKALAKSVHGDTVFGDLPKPRYSTYI